MGAGPLSPLIQSVSWSNWPLAKGSREYCQKTSVGPDDWRCQKSPKEGEPDPAGGRSRQATKSKEGRQGRRTETGKDGPCVGGPQGFLPGGVIGNAEARRSNRRRFHRQGGRRQDASQKLGRRTTLAKLLAGRLQELASARWGRHLASCLHERSQRCCQQPRRQL